MAFLIIGFVLAAILMSDDPKLKKLIVAAKALRAAQQAYMADRGNETLGKAVGEAAENLDRVLKEVEK